MLCHMTVRAAEAAVTSYLLHKRPDRVQRFDLTFGTAHVFYPVYEPDRVEVALWVDVDPIGWMRRAAVRAGDGTPAYVNDRPYAASSLLSVALAEVFGSALNGRCAQRPDAVDVRFEWEARLPVVRVRGGESWVNGIFEPMGYAVHAEPVPLDPGVPRWGNSRLWDVRLRHGSIRMCEALRHLYVLVPVLDGSKHYWVDDAEVDKMQRHGDGWLGAHPMRDAIVERGLLRQRSLVRRAAELIPSVKDDAEPEAEVGSEAGAAADAAECDRWERPLNLHEQRLGAVVAALRAAGARRILDLGCGEGRLLRWLQKEPMFTEIVGLDVSIQSLQLAADRLGIQFHVGERDPGTAPERVRLMHGSVLYRDRRLDGFDAASVVEVVEHLDPPRLAAFERSVFGWAKPRVVVVTTPNRDYNVKFEGLAPGALRHADHRFEWGRSAFQEWGATLAERYGYRVTYLGIGPEDAELGAPTQMAQFEREAE